MKENDILETISENDTPIHLYNSDIENQIMRDDYSTLIDSLLLLEDFSNKSLEQWLETLANHRKKYNQLLSHIIYQKISHLRQHLANKEKRHLFLKVEK